jgi:hypothetical protein
MKAISAIVLFLSVAAFAANPVVSDVSFAQDSSRVVTIEYKLTGAPAVITFSVETNAGDNVWLKTPDEERRFAHGALSHASCNRTRPKTKRSPGIPMVRGRFSCWMMKTYVFT